MNPKILLISLVALLVFFSGCIVEEAEPLDEEFAAFEGTWHWDNMKINEINKIEFTINADGTGRYMEYFSEGADFECATFIEISKKDISIYCQMLSVSREFSVIEEPLIESSNPKMILKYDEVEGDMIFARIN